MGKKKAKSTGKVMPMRTPEEKGIPCQLHAHARKHLTAEGVARNLDGPLEQVLMAMIGGCSDHSFALVVVPGDKRLSVKKRQGSPLLLGVRCSGHRIGCHLHDAVHSLGHQARCCLRQLYAQLELKPSDGDESGRRDCL